MRSALFVFAVVWAGGAAFAGDEHRQLGAHEHGHGTFNMAIEGKQVMIELEAPGADLVGFEHQAKTDADKAAIEEVRAVLEKPLNLFIFPKSAACSVDHTTASIIGESERHGEHQGAEMQAGSEPESHANEEPEQARHNEFHAQYRLTCDEPAAIKVLTFGYFDAFPGADELEVNVISETGQTSYEVERSKRQISLEGVM